MREAVGRFFSAVGLFVFNFFASIIFGLDLRQPGGSKRICNIVKAINDLI